MHSAKSIYTIQGLLYVKETIIQCYVWLTTRATQVTRTMQEMKCFNTL